MKKQAFILIIIISFISFLLYGNTANAEIKTITATHTYKMGDNDSRNEARRICFIEAKRSVLEQAGTYIQSSTEVGNYQLSKDEITTYSAALLSVETVTEKWETMAVTITVKAVVDTGYIDKQLSKITKNTPLQKQIKAQQDKIIKLEKAMSSMQDKIKSADVNKATELKKERNVVISEIDTIEGKKIEIIERINKQTQSAKKYITPGMTQQDIQSLLGTPDGTERAYFARFRRVVSVWHYGKTKVIFNAANIVDSVE
jgi:outer membrane protein assembly factor BamE (lipoprotein component of BamABCDE complex)